MYYGHMGLIGGFWMLIFWGLFIWLIIWLVTQNRNKGARYQGPKERLKERLAEGEISSAEYDRLLKKISG